MYPTPAYPRRIGQPLTEPVTLAQALHHLRESADGAENDAYIMGLISVAREACEEHTERTLISTPLLLTTDGFTGALKLRNPPVVSIQSVQFLDESGVLQTLDPLDYLLDNASEPGYLVPAPGKSWPATQAGAINTVRVTYIAGYGDTPASVPNPLKHWILLAVGSMYAMRNGSSDRPSVAHDFSDKLIDKYRFMGV